ncbi:MAG: serine/threonine-protein kinase [Enhygromyxa sp.]
MSTSELSGELGDETEIAGPIPATSGDAATLAGSDSTLLAGTGSATGPGASMSGRVPEPNSRVGHFIVRDTLGVGGMGVVLRVHDEHLDRTVALKLVRPEVDERDSRTHGTERLLVEARAMAKISHPNVITVHEVGVVEGKVFLAMEYIDGRTLGDWVAARRRPWTELVDRWIEAGRGLRAAHEAGLVHRDFKPANVLVSNDGRVLVTDFGIAGGVEPGSEPAPETPTDTPTDAHTQSETAPEPGSIAGELTRDLSRRVGRLTQTGGMLGTPRYMAPEQFLGKRVDARADQFAFCVSLWEAVYERHPFDASNIAALAFAASTGQLREPPARARRRVPDRLRRILARGLSAEPADRYPELSELLAELTALRHRGARRRRIAAVLVSVPLVAAGLWAAWPAAPDPCTPAGERWAGVWDPAAQAEIEGALGESELPYVRQSWPRLQAKLDAYTSAWDEHQQRACRDTRVHETVSESLLDRRMSCLDTRRRRIAALVGQLRQGDAEVLEHALELAAQLPALDDCDDLSRLEGAVPPPAPELQEQLAAFEQAIAEAETFNLAERGDLAAAELEPWEQQLAELDYPPAEMRLFATLAQSWSGRDNSKSCELHRRAYAKAVAADDTEFATKHALQLASCKTDREIDAFADFWLEVAAAGYRQLERELDYSFYATRAFVLRERREHELATVAAELALRHANEQPDLHNRLLAVANLGALLAEQRKFDEGKVHIERAVELATELYGPHHPTTLQWRANQVALGAMQGKDFEGVLRQAEALLEAQESGLGPERDAIAVTLTIMGMVLRQLDDLERATECDARALKIREQVLGPNHWQTIESLEKLARDHVASNQLDQLDQGISELRRVIDLRAELHGPEHVEVGRSYGALAWALEKDGQLAQAVAAHRRGLEILIAAVGEEHYTVYQALGELGGTLVETEEFAEAEQVLLRAIELSEPHSPPPRETARMLLHLSQARRGLGRGAKPVREPAEQALELLKAEDPTAPIREEIEEWLAG